VSAPYDFAPGNADRLRIQLLTKQRDALLAALRKLDCVNPSLPGPSDCSDDYRRGWLAALEAAYIQGEQARAAIAKVQS
jgi:hypothetical protein